MTGRAGINAVSSAQSRWMGTGVERGGTGLEGGGTRDRDCETVTAGGSDMVAAVKGTGFGETARLGSSWGKTGCTDGDRGMDGERGVLTGVDSVVGNTAGVYNAVGGETVRFCGFGGEQGRWDVFCGCFVGPGNVSCHFVAAVRVPVWGRAGGSTVVDDDVAAAWGGSMYGTGGLGMSCGEPRGRGGVLARRWVSLGW